MWKHGRKPRGLTILQRLEARSKTDGDCKRWQGNHNRNGYGTITIDGRKELVHRVSASLSLGLELRSSNQANHKSNCSHRDCWNSEHLYVGTQKDNNKDTISSGHHISGYGVAKRRG